MYGNADEALAAEQSPRMRRIASGRQVDAIEAGDLGKLGVAMKHQPGAEAVRDRQQAFCQRDLLVRGKIPFAHAEPAAAGNACSLDDVRDRRSRLPAIADQQQRGLWEPHVPTRPNCGLDGSAFFDFGIRPESRANRPASTAARIAAAILTGSRALETAVL